MVDVSQPLQKKPADGLEALNASEQIERLRLALMGSSVAGFDWTVADDRIAWDGALEIVPYHADPQRLARGSAFVSWLSPESRGRLAALIDTRTPQNTQFDLSLEASTAMGSIWLTMVGCAARAPTAAPSG